MPMMVAGDANVWRPHFTFGRSRSADNMIVPFIDLLISSCGLVLFFVALCWGQITPSVGTTNFLRPEVSDAPRSIPLLRDWRPTLLRAINQFSLWTEKILLQISSEQPLQEVDRTSILDGLCTEMLSILTAHSPGPRQRHRRRQPAGGTQIVWQHVLHGMVLFGTTTGCVLQSLTCGSAQHGNSSIAQSVQPAGHRPAPSICHRPCTTHTHTHAHTRKSGSNVFPNGRYSPILPSPC